MTYDSRDDTLDHIGKVQARLAECIAALYERSLAHDASKLVEPEKAGFDALTPKLSSLTYGSDEYKAALEEGKPTIVHHYAANDHHPEHYPAGIAGMSLLSILEMLADWRAASERVNKGSIEQSLVVNIKRFGIDPQLAHILENTIKELGW